MCQGEHVVDDDGNNNNALGWLWKNTTCFDLVEGTLSPGVRDRNVDSFVCIERGDQVPESRVESAAGELWSPARRPWLILPRLRLLVSSNDVLKQQQQQPASCNKVSVVHMALEDIDVCEGSS